jgi:hypothetical protein
MTKVKLIFLIYYGIKFFDVFSSDLKVYKKVQNIVYN